jgi:hypothetical protein
VTALVRVNAPHTDLLVEELGVIRRAILALTQSR